MHWRIDLGAAIPRLATLLAVLLLSGPIAVQAQTPDDSRPLLSDVAINEQTFKVASADGPQIELQITVLRPPGAGPFPLAVMNHGAAEFSYTNRGSRYRRTLAALYFLSRGYAVVLPMMRGFAGSGGDMDFGGCDATRVAQADARDIEAVIDFMAQERDIDASRTIVAGQSFGGWNTLAVGALGAPNVAGLINFVGGLEISSCHDHGASLIDGAHKFGARTTAPSIWFYGDNDSLFEPKLWRSMHAAYTAGGGKAELVAFGRFEPDSHLLLRYARGVGVWAPRLDAFLARLGLPAKDINPEYMPRVWPDPTGFAATKDVAAVPFVGDSGRSLYRAYLDQPPPKAFLISPTGAAFEHYGDLDPIREAFAQCGKAKQVCAVYAADDDVVWTPPPGRASPSRYAPIGDVASVPYLNDAGRELYQRFLAHTGPRALAISPNGSAYAWYGGAKAWEMAWLDCRQHQARCELYAVDDDVVWVHPTAVPGPSGFAPLTDVGSVPFLKPEGRSGYARFLTEPKPRAFAVAPDGAWSAAARGPDPVAAALSRCSQSHSGCRLYAVDDDVVWTRSP